MLTAKPKTVINVRFFISLRIIVYTDGFFHVFLRGGKKGPERSRRAGSRVVNPERHERRG